MIELAASINMLRITDLTIDYQYHPLGIDNDSPRLSWKLKSDRQGTFQTSYRIVLMNNQETLIDTSTIKSDQSIHVSALKDLLPETEYIVTVTVTDNHNEVAMLSTQFETGLMDYRRIQADFITAAALKTSPTQVLCREFVCLKPIRKARLYATSLGVYDLYLNKERVGDSYLTPFWTSYHHQLQYQTFDITDRVKDHNIIEMTLAEGWYKGQLAWEGNKEIFGDTLAGLLEIHMEYQDGSKELIVTDKNWIAKESEIRKSSLYHGDTLDYQFSAKATYPVSVYSYDKSVIVSQITEPVRVIESLPARQLIKTPKGETVIDFGQILTGVVRFKLTIESGKTVTLRHAEILDKHGNFYTENLRTAKAEDAYIGDGKHHTFQPRFTFHGFRYVQVIGLDLNPDDCGNFEALVMHSDLKPIGSFQSSHQDLNQLYHNLVWSQKGNFLDVPTDCPQRDERLGWTGDAQVFCRTASTNYQSALFFRKWLQDVKLEQTLANGVPHVVPNVLGQNNGATFWGDCATIMPWILYQVYGDRDILRRQFSSMKLWVDHISSRSEGFLWKQGFQFGDWLALDRTLDDDIGQEGDNRIGSTDPYFIATVFYHVSAKLVSDAAKVLGYPFEAETYRQLAMNIKRAFNKEYVTPNGRLVSDTQTAHVLALHFDMVAKKHRKSIMNRLVHILEKRKVHLVTGFVGTPYICFALSENGRNDLAGKLLLNNDYPSWLYAVKRGATTIWERWNGILPNGDFNDVSMNSFNHYAYGSIGEWIYRKLVGIDCLEPGYKKILISPTRIEGIDWVDGHIDSPYGIIRCLTRYDGNHYTLEVTIPANTEAVVKMANRKMTLVSGAYTLEGTL
ncbi:MAG: family 78 glycoside hydrolase catalytic domain [Candidatus Izemoplasmatales bacterium]